jgi:integrase
MIKQGIVRTSINRHVARIKQVFKWGVSQELVPPEVYSSLCTVTGLRRDRSDAVESDPVEPVPEDDIEAVKPYVTAPVWAMIRLQLLTGMRPSEVRGMRNGDIDPSGAIWQYIPRRHKTQHRGRRRIIFLGPRAQLVLRPFLGDDPERFVFRPMEGRADYVERNYRTGARVHVINRQGNNECYSHHGYACSIRRACKRAAVAPWSPGRLRHNAASLIRKEFGDIDAVRCVLGHADTPVSALYAERDFCRAAEVMRQIG